MRKVADKAGKSTEVYDADGTGVVVGLCCFGSETIAWSRTFSPDASVDEPEWVADFTKTPPPGTAVRVRVQKRKQRGPGFGVRVSVARFRNPKPGTRNPIPPLTHWDQC